MLRYSLILFDEDGCTAVVETKKLYGDGPIGRSVQCNFGLAVGVQYKVEVLEMSDLKTELNNFEMKWVKTHRSVALDEAKKRRGNEIGGYLAIWPQDGQEMTGSEDESEESGSNDMVHVREEVTARKTRLGARADSSNKTPTRQKQAGKRKRCTTVPSPTPTTNETLQHSTIMGTNSRKVTVLYEGSGDYDKQGSEPQRAPFFTNHLSQDQMDILKLQVEEHQKSKRTFSVQTDKVVVMTDANELMKLVEKEPAKTSDCICQQLSEVVRMNAEKLDKLTSLVMSIKEKLDEKFDNSLMSVSILENLTIPTAETVMVENEDANDQPAPTTSIELEELNDLGRRCTEGVSEEFVHNEPEVMYYTTCTNERAKPVSLLSPNHMFTALQAPVQRRCFTQLCSKGTIVEVCSLDDVPCGDFEVRVHPELQRKVKLSSCSIGNFGWLLAKQLFSTEEMAGKNYHGRKGKELLSPRRIHAIEHAAIDMYGEGDNVRLLSNGINTGIRNSQRQPFRQLFGNLNQIVQ